VFVDECSTNTSLSPIYGWSRRGQRVCFEAPRNWGANVTLLSSMSFEGMGPSLAMEGSTTREVFETYVDRVLAPSLSSGQIVVMDNLSSHRGSRIKELIEARGCELIYLPPYSPDFNPIEEAFRGGQRAPATSRGTHPRSPAGSDGSCPRCGERERRPGLLRASRLPSTGSTAMTDALEAC
jgi:hypothetical protein